MGSLISWFRHWSARSKARRAQAIYNALMESKAARLARETHAREGL
jgi:hypothetical protein